MKFRCPYCKQELEKLPCGGCPRCGRVMNIPGRLRPLASAAERNRAKARIRGDANRAQRGMTHLPMGLTQRKPVHLVVAILLLAVVGAALVGRVQRIAARPPGPSRSLLRAEEDLRTLRLALEQFRRDCGRYPADAEGLMSLITPVNAPGWRGPYLTLLKRDPWHHPYDYRYQATNGVYSLQSHGPDGIAGTGDDMDINEVE